MDINEKKKQQKTKTKKQKTKQNIAYLLLFQTLEITNLFFGQNFKSHSLTDLNSNSKNIRDEPFGRKIEHHEVNFLSAKNKNK